MKFTHFLYLLLFFLAFSFFYHSDLSFDQDLGRHLKLGEIIWQTREVPKTNLFSYTQPDFPFINHHWGFEVIIYLLSSTIGLQLLLVLKLVALLAVAAGILFLARKTESVLIFPFSYIFLHLLRGRSELRPEIMSFLFTLGTLYILEKFEKDHSKIIYVLPLISLVWVNSHIYFPVGIFLQIIFLMNMLFQKFVQKKKEPLLLNKIKIVTLVTLLSLLAALLNPNFIKGAVYPFTVFTNYGVTITENQTITTLQKIHFVNPDFFFFYFAAFLVFASIYVSFWRTKFSLKNICLSLLGFALAVQSIRGFPYLALISLPYVLLNCNFKIASIWTKALNISLGILLFGEAVFYLNGGYYAMTYKPYVPSLLLTQDALPALDYVIKNKLPQPIFNNFDIGSYIIYRGYPDYKVFIDGRPEAYPASFFEDMYIPMQEDYKKFKNEDKKVRFQTVIFSLTDQNPRTITFLNALTTDPQWKIVFLDQFMIVLVKNAVQQKLQLKPIDLAKLTSDDFHYSTTVQYTNLSTFLFNMHQFAVAKKVNQKALDINPDNPAANNIMAFILLYQHSKDPKFYDYKAKASNAVFW